MFVFKRSMFSLVWNMIIALFLALLVCVVLYWFNISNTIIIIVGVIIALIFGLSVIFDENIKFTIDKKNIFTYYRKKKIVNQINLADYYFGYKSKTSDGQSDYFYLNLINPETEEEINIDCTPLGANKFDSMISVIEKKAKKQIMKTIIAEEKDKIV